MKDAIDEVTNAVEALMAMARKFDRGQVIAWKSIEAIAGDRRESRPRHIITKWQRRLENEREIVTLCVSTVGVKLLTHLETARDIPRLRQRKAYRQIRRAIKQTAMVDVANLGDHDRRLLVAQRQNMADTRRDLFRSQKQSIQGVQPSETNPRRKIAV